MKTTITILFLFISVLFLGAQSSDRDRQFIEEAAQSNLLEIKLGELAQAKANSIEIKTLGRQMMAAHEKSNVALTALAARQNATVPVNLSTKGQNTYDMLAEKQGENFDKAYTKCMISDHKKNICLFKKEAKKGDDIDLKGFASGSVKMLEHHKQMAKEAYKALKKNSMQVNAKLATATTH